MKKISGVLEIPNERINYAGGNIHLVVNVETEQGEGKIEVKLDNNAVQKLFEGFDTSRHLVEVKAKPSPVKIESEPARVASLFREMNHYRKVSIVFERNII